jgi:hypothetical protein
VGPFLHHQGIYRMTYEQYQRSLPKPAWGPEEELMPLASIGRGARSDALYLEAPRSGGMPVNFRAENNGRWQSFFIADINRGLIRGEDTVGLRTGRGVWLTASETEGLIATETGPVVPASGRFRLHHGPVSGRALRDDFHYGDQFQLEAPDGRFLSIIGDGNLRLV